MADISPFKLTETEPGSFSLLCSEFQPHESTFVECGYEGGGYDWEAVARQIIRSHAPHLAERVNFDPEGSMFCAYGQDKEALEELGVLMRDTFNDKDALSTAIKEADPDWFD